MTVRSLDWRDLPALIRYRNQSLYLDSTRLLTVGARPVSARALLSYLSFSTGIHLYSSCQNGAADQVMLAQVQHAYGKPFARLSYVTPASAASSGLLTRLVEHIVKDIGERGATHLLAEANEDELVFEALRKAGFATFARQRIWQYTGTDTETKLDSLWRPGTIHDLSAVRSLYANLVPGLVQQVEQPPLEQLHGLVLRQKDNLVAYVDIKYGPRGIVLQPFIHPDLEEAVDSFKNLLDSLPHRRSRPIYICIRSYQSWVEQALDKVGAEAGPRQAVMVRHLAVLQKNMRVYVYHALERGHPEVSAPITRRIIEKYDPKRNN